MELSVLKRQFLEVEIYNPSPLRLNQVLGDVYDMAIEICNKKYETDTMLMVHLSEEISELIQALANSIPPVHNKESLWWRKSNQWFNFVEELVDVGLYIQIVNQVLNTHLDQDVVLTYEYKEDARMVIQIVQDLSYHNQQLLKGIRKQFDADTKEEGVALIRKTINELYSICSSLQYKFRISAEDVDRMLVIKVNRIINRYHDEFSPDDENA